ncbi:MAG: endonuclease III [Planctomycetota bacterium]|nr:endonuclease III [Planctomycetota bacterium]
MRLKSLPSNKLQPLKRKSPLQVDRAKQLWKALSLRYPNAHCALNWSQPHELLIATILSAQSTDVGVNKATPALFKAFPSIEAFAKCEPSEIEPFVKTLNFWRNKAKAVVESMKMIQEVFGGKVPSTMNELLQLRGVARKTANVVLGNAFDKNDGVVVDTHVGRLSQRFGLSRESDPIKVEQDLMALFPRKNWCQLSHLLIAHGRSVCKARGNTCREDAICKEYCCEGKLKRSIR